MSKIIPLEVRDNIDDYPEYQRLKGLKDDSNNKELLLLLRESLLNGHIFWKSVVKLHSIF